MYTWCVMVLATKYLILALTFILSASQPGISPEQKTELLNQAAINVSKVIPAYIEEQQIASSTSTPSFGAAQPTPQDSQIITNINNEAMVKADRIKELKDISTAKSAAWNATRARIAENKAASDANQLRKKEAAIVPNIGLEINAEDKRLSDEYTNVLLPLYQSQAQEATKAEIEWKEAGGI